MNDELLHMALLAAYGNAFLSGAGVPFPSMSALQSVRFRGAGAEAEEGEDAWFTRLQRGGCREIGLFFEYGEEDWTRTAFPNGVPGWELVCRYDGSAARWRRYWDGKSVDGAFLWFAEYTEAADPAAREYPDRIGAQARFEHLQALLVMLSQLAGAIRAYDWKARFAALHDGMDYFRSRRLIDASMLPRVYSDEARNITARSDGEPHNAVTPIIRRDRGAYVLDIVLRNNVTTDEFPMGMYHPHTRHNIKKENIGLIEVMGLFILPGRLQNELFGHLKPFLRGKAPMTSPEYENPDHPLYQHRAFILEMAEKWGTSLGEEEAERAIREELGFTCLSALHDCGVFKDTRDGIKGFNLFMKACGMELIK
jgi:hypothetical protein